jgi:phosphoenolpyruvate synthase/pyruvate phosphate dikinase
METIRNLDAVGKDDVALVGGKGASLGEMVRAGMPVPAGFVILSAAFERFVDEAGLRKEIDALLDRVNPQETGAIEGVSQAIRSLILAADMPENIASEIRGRFSELGAEYVAVRSSATAEDSAAAAWAGQLDTFLNTAEGELLENVRKCWASLFTPRAIAYRFEKGFQTAGVSVAVVVQEMVQSEVSGTAFSADPVTGKRDRIVIEAGYGLGEAVVAGRMTPDSYVVGKDLVRILDKKVNMQKLGMFRKPGGGNEWRDIEESKRNLQKLPDGEILRLSELVLKIEDIFGFPCDVEWTYAGGEFFILQSRPITALASSESGLVRYKKTYTRENSLIALQIWEEHQCRLLKEVLGDVVPLSIFDVYDGVAEVYYHERIFDIWGDLVTVKMKDDPSFVFREMKYLGELVDKLEAAWKQGTLSSVQGLVELFDVAARAWVGVSVSYFLPSMTNMSGEAQALGMALRQRSVDFLEHTDHVIQNTLRSLYPELGDLVKYLSIEEVKRNDIPETKVLRERQRHCIYFGFKLHVGKDVDELARENGILIEREPVPADASELKGQTAMGGRARGRVRILRKKSEIPLLQEGEILVTAMTTPDYLPAMRKAAAFVTDEGGVTCHAAIVAREIGKPCVIGTGVATQALRDGDLVEVDADQGVVRILEKK